MTREEILDQAKVGGFAIVRLGIASAAKDGSISVYHPSCRKTVWHSLEDSVVSIEPPPLTIEQQLANALAEIERLKAEKPQETVPQMPDGKGWMRFNGEAIHSEATVEVTEKPNIYQGHMLAAHVNWDNVLYYRVVKGTNSWRDHDGGDMPCDSDLMIEIQTRDNMTFKGDARTWRWKHNPEHKIGDVMRWRPHKEEGQWPTQTALSFRRV